jgi:formylglycine-generating enzyme required for sulfatase activity
MPRVLDGWQDDYQVVAPPGKFRANGFGIFDMTGNVSEWVHDAYVSFEANAGGTDPLGPAAAGTRRVIKGSNWRTVSFADLRAAWREGADEGAEDIGFRVARYAE